MNPIIPNSPLDNKLNELVTVFENETAKETASRDIPGIIKQIAREIRALQNEYSDRASREAIDAVNKDIGFRKHHMLSYTPFQLELHQHVSEFNTLLEKVSLDEIPGVLEYTTSKLNLLLEKYPEFAYLTKYNHNHMRKEAHKILAQNQQHFEKQESDLKILLQQYITEFETTLTNAPLKEATIIFKETTEKFNLLLVKYTNFSSLIKEAHKSIIKYIQEDNNKNPNHFLTRLVSDFEELLERDTPVHEISKYAKKINAILDELPQKYPDQDLSSAIRNTRELIQGVFNKSLLKEKAKAKKLDIQNYLVKLESEFKKILQKTTHLHEIIAFATKVNSRLTDLSQNYPDLDISSDVQNTRKRFRTLLEEKKLALLKEKKSAPTGLSLRYHPHNTGHHNFSEHTEKEFKHGLVKEESRGVREESKDNT